MDEGNGALVRVQAEPEAVWEAAFYLEEGDAITTWAFWVQNMSWCAAGSDSSLSSHLMPAWWHSGWGSDRKWGLWPRMGWFTNAWPERPHGQN